MNFEHNVSHLFDFDQVNVTWGNGYNKKNVYYVCIIYLTH